MNEQHETTYNSKLNPFLSVWLNTRNTVRYVIEEKSMVYVFLLILLTGITSTFVSLYQGTDDIGIPIGILIVGSAIISPIAVAIGIAIMSGIYLLVGKLFKGTGTYIELFKAVATSMIPQIWLLPLFLILMIVSPDLFFAGSESASNGAIFFMAIFAVILAIVTIWGIVIQSKAIGEAHRFSSWKGFFTLLIPSLIIGIIVIAFMVIIFMILIGTASL
ncbi:Yip1 family protein [Planococcus ruber]|uniref:Yip1 family protein n=1 Tax=Planococcus ruber TaxID=2027871 RepID=UPI001FF02D1D|nr:Yip1 family protein [Planococcus ruber]MCJ1908916.1 YIP1 family protein [Planococcus ruber]